MLRSNVKKRHKGLVQQAKFLALPYLCGSLVALAQGGAVYRCDSAAGIAFQDTPCPPQQRQTRLQFAPPPPPPAAALAEPDAPVAPTPATEPPPVPARPAMAPPSFHLCRAGDGSHYRSASGVGRSNWVPYTMVDGRNRSLAEAYGGRDGLASHGSDAASIPHRPAAPGSAAGYYVEVTDPCHLAAPAEACAWLQDGIAALDRRLRTVSGDAAATLREERDRLVAEAQGCR